MSEDAPERKVALGPNSYGSLRDGIDPVVLIFNSTRLDTSQGLAELLHHRADLGVASREGHGLIGTINLIVDLAHREMTAAVPHRPHSTKVPALTSAHSTGRWSTVMPRS